MSGDEDGLAGLSDEALQDLFDRVVAAYARRVEEHVDAERSPLEPFPAQRQATATDVVIAARRMLAAFGLSPFELSLLPRF